MSFYSKQKWFCNNCGKEMFTAPHKAIVPMGSRYSCCSLACSREMNWKNTLSTLGKEYCEQVIEGETK